MNSGPHSRRPNPHRHLQTVAVTARSQTLEFALARSSKDCHHVQKMKQATDKCRHESAHERHDLSGRPSDQNKY